MPSTSKTKFLFLSVEVMKARVKRLQPFGGTSLDVLDRLAQGEILGQNEQGMNMVNGAADLQRMRLNLVEYSGKVLMKPLGNLWVKHRHSVFGAEDQMNIQL